MNRAADTTLRVGKDRRRKETRLRQAATQTATNRRTASDRSIAQATGSTVEAQIQPRKANSQAAHMSRKRSTGGLRKARASDTTLRVGRKTSTGQAANTHIVNRVLIIERAHLTQTTICFCDSDSAISEITHEVTAAGKCARNDASPAK